MDLDNLGTSLGATATGAAAGSSFGPWGSIIGAGIGAASSLFGGQQQNSANQAMSQAQMDFQERMRATQYQTTTADLKAAGLNPMLAYSQGGAGTPAGATAQMGNPLGEAGHSAREAGMAMAQYEQLKTQNFATEMTGENQGAQALTQRDQAALLRAQRNKTTEEAVSEVLKQKGFGLSEQEARARIKQLYGSANLANTNAAYTAATQPEAEAIGNAYKTMPLLKAGEKIGTIVRDVGSGITSAASAARGKSTGSTKTTYNERGQKIRREVTSNQPPME